MYRGCRAQLLNGYYIPDISVNWYRNSSPGMATEQNLKHTGKKKKIFYKKKATLKLKTKSM